MRYLGVDLHTNSFTVCYLESETDHERIQTYNLQKDLDQFIAGLQKTDEVAFEATGNSSFFRDKIAPHVKRVVVIAPGEFDVIRKSVRKTDKHDARAMALFLKKDMLPEARLKSKEHEQISSLISTREQLVKTRTALINKTHSLFNRHGLKIKKETLTSTKGFERSIASYQQWERMERIEIDAIRDQLTAIDKNIKTLNKEIADQAEKLAGFKNLESIKGIGSLSAAVLLTTIGDIKNFKKPENLASYFGIVPKVSQSNQQCTTGRITKRGSKAGRRTLIQCTWVAIRYSPYLNDFYEKMKKKKGAGKAIVATAHQLLNTNWLHK
jgi:transposase